MATDPITGLSLDDDQAQQTLDYLGRSSPLGLAQQTALPGSQGAAPSAGPSSVGGSGQAAPTGSLAPTGAAPAGQSVSANFGQNTNFPNTPPGLGTQLGARAAGLIAGQGKGQLQNLIPAGGIGGALGSGGNLLGVGGEFAGAIPVEELLANPGLYGETGTAIAGLGDAAPGLASSLGGSAAELGLGSALGAYGGMSALYDLFKLGLNLAGVKGGPTTGNTWGDLGFSLLGPYGDIGKAAVGKLLEPSSAWQTFGERLGGTLQGESSAINTLLPWLGKAQTRGDINQSLDFFRQLVDTGAGVGGYQLGAPTASGAPQVGLLPGATGKGHEGGLQADFGPVTAALNDYIAKLYDVLPEGGASAPLTYESYAAGWTPDVYAQMAMLANDVKSLPPDQQAAYIAQTGLAPEFQEKLGSMVASDPTYNAWNRPYPAAE